MDPDQERIAHLERIADDLSEVVADQAGRIAALERRVAALLQRAAEAEQAGSGGVTLGDERPPHW
ncbi:SlyX family protein [Jannaschia sp. LMIT008]|uniref:SlyX family protein n=1 Tax=Jannaschia maritima TaxID=3032585 RepID=UPI002811F19A|nr:SlyX family protein [Jannaschia sp. LMIT008]